MNLALKKGKTQVKITVWLSGWNECVGKVKRWRSKDSVEGIGRNPWECGVLFLRESHGLFHGSAKLS